MDSDPKYIARGAVLIFSACILVFLLVYALNRDSSSGGSTASKIQDASSDTSETSAVYGTRIGDNLKAFLTLPGFFDGDEAEDDASVSLTEGSDDAEQTAETGTDEGDKDKELSYFVQAGDGDITLTFVDEQSFTVTGERFSFSITKKIEGYTAEMTYTDEDEDGVITAKGLSPGVWEITLHNVNGWTVPQDVIEVALDTDEYTGEENAGDGENTDAGENTDGGEIWDR